MCVSFHAFAILWNNFVITAQNLQIKIFVFFQSFDTRKVRLRWDPMQRVVCECVRERLEREPFEVVWKLLYEYVAVKWQILQNCYTFTKSHCDSLSVRPTDRLFIEAILLFEAFLWYAEFRLFLFIFFPAVCAIHFIIIVLLFYFAKKRKM